MKNVRSIMPIKGFGLVSRSKTGKKLKRVAKIAAILPVIFASIIVNGLKRRKAKTAN